MISKFPDKRWSQFLRQTQVGSSLRHNKAWFTSVCRGVRHPGKNFFLVDLLIILSQNVTLCLKFNLKSDQVWVAGLIWSEIKQLWDVGLKEYVSDMWNVVDFITNSLYVATIGLRLRAYYDVSCWPEYLFLVRPVFL